MPFRRLYRIFLCVFALTSISTLAQRVDTAVVSKSRSPGECAAPPSAASFKPTDAEVWTFSIVSSGKAGDVMTYVWLRPDGEAHFLMPFGPLPRDGGFCFEYSMKIAGTDAVRYPGQWTALGVWNSGNILFRINFILEAAGASNTAALSVPGTSNLFAYGQTQAFSGTPPPVLEPVVRMAQRKFRAIQGRVNDRTAQRRIYGLLARRGFDADTCARVTRQVCTPSDA